MTQNFTIKYPPQTKVYAATKAKQGALEPVTIQKCEAAVDKEGRMALYTDTLNRIWLERELCSYTDAINHALAYYNGLLEQVKSES